MSKLDTFIDNRVVQNLFIWLCLFFIFMGVVQSDQRIVTASYIIALLAPSVYLNNLFILPLFTKNKIYFWIGFVLNATVFTSISSFLLARSLEQEFGFKMFMNLFGILILALTFGSAVKISRDSFLRRQEEKNAELKLLKAQLNPHFLFNTLNNLYGLSVVKSDRLPELMLKLSDLLRYSLYDTKELYTSLEKEMQYLENYISLERIRLEDRTEITFEKLGDFSNKRIAPMLLIVFVENAFKHLGDVPNALGRVQVRIEINGSMLTFHCSNTMDDTIVHEGVSKEKSGIGLKNAKKRLSLLYLNKHTFQITKKENQFNVDLSLDLT